jgi:hypothetical protein
MISDRLKAPLFVALLLALSVPFNTLAGDEMGGLLPPVTCGSSWVIEGKPLSYDRETLSDRINGEAELYLPYGFDRMAAARYIHGKNPESGMDVEIYRMGSTLDAFGMFANYRQMDGRSLSVGAGSNLSGSQLFLYQGRYFVHIQTTGSSIADQGALSGCAQAVAALLPGASAKPSEISVFDRPEVLKGTERYLPQSLLGYDFLNKGLMADASLDGKQLQIFILLGSTAESASVALDSYRSQLTRTKVEPVSNEATFVEGIDPLYGPVTLLRKGGCLAGALKYSGNKGLRPLLERICQR